MKKLLLFLIGIGVLYGTVVYGLPAVQYFNTDVMFKKAVWDSASSTGSSGQVLSSTGTSTLWINASAGSGGSGRTGADFERAA